jgi:hypothetical protein
MSLLGHVSLALVAELDVLGVDIPEPSTAFHRPLWFVSAFMRIHAVARHA